MSRVVRRVDVLNNRISECADITGRYRGERILWKASECILRSSVLLDHKRFDIDGQFAVSEDRGSWPLRSIRFGKQLIGRHTAEEPIFAQNTGVVAWVVGHSAGSAEVSDESLHACVIGINFSFFFHPCAGIEVVIGWMAICCHDKFQISPEKMPFSLNAAIGQRSDLWRQIGWLH